MWEVVALTVLALFLACAAWTGRVRFFVASLYVWLPPTAAVLLFAMAVARALQLRGNRGESCCDEAHAPAPKAQLFYALIILIPIVAAVSVDPRQFSTEGMRKRRAAAIARDGALDRAMNWALGMRTAGARPAEAVLPPEPTLYEIINAVEAGHKENLTGRFVTVIGQCSLRDGASDRFELYRMVVTCCVADATAVSLDVVRPVGAKIEPGQWVRVGGVIKFDDSANPQQPVIHATIVTMIPTPHNPYL